MLMRSSNFSIRTGVPVLLTLGVVVCLAIVPAMCQRGMQVNGDVMDDLRPIRANGQIMVPARPFFRKIGGELECTADGYCVRRGGHTYRFRPRTNVYYYDETPRYFPGAPFVRSGRLYVPPDPFVRDWGGRFYYDAGRWRAEFPASWMGPGNLRLDSPRSGALLRANYVIVDGYASAGRDLQILVYWHAPFEPGQGRIIYTTPTRVQANGYYQARIPLAGNGRYRVVVQLLNDLGGIEDEETRWFAAR